MTTKREKVAKLMVYTDLTQKEIGRQINVSENTITRWKKQEDFQKLLKENEKSYMKDLVAPAMRGLKDLINATSEFVKLEAVKTILDRAGYDSIDDRLRELDIEKQQTQIKKTKTEIEIMKGISEEVEDLDDIDGIIYGKD
ncbi:phBC6A51 family helix-turn-helix protein [Anaerococcus vaginalis]|uniref:phBC6A51 family helix-turn-helix protein n=1 Tax=Anaerococcus vaginalis TaxID=33037 RepID=UPI0022E59344|nr:phBC6A51 family helix-turn-helix protein [Anaerococcus vaginalis]